MYAKTIDELGIVKYKGCGRGHKWMDLEGSTPSHRPMPSCVDY